MQIKTNSALSIFGILLLPACRGGAGVPAYVGGPVCSECHAAQAAAWTGSHHDLAMQEASEESVLGDFTGTTFSYFGKPSSFYEEDGEFFVRTVGPDGNPHDYRISHTFGVTPLQQYLIEFPNGRRQALSIAWDSRPRGNGGQRWFHLYPDEEITSDDPLHWTGPNQNWNSICAECHSTNVQKNFDFQTGQYNTTWSEIDVSCEACHGPGSEHVRWARRGAGSDRPNGLTVDLGDRTESVWAFDAGQSNARQSTPRTTHAQIETCAQCHARRGTLQDDHTPGDAFLNSHRPALLEQGLYHPDGQILDEVYVYGSFLQSKMFGAGVTCSDCHDPHSARVYDRGNALCARCHLPSTYDVPAHHFHETESPGARCVECHMPEANYMVIDPRRDHSLRVPRPDLSVSIGTPNACTQCHTDRSPEWASRAVNGWYGSDREPHYGEALQLGRLRVPAADTALARLVGDNRLPDIVRATALGLLGNYASGISIGVIRSALIDSAPLVRFAAVRSTEIMEPNDRYTAAYALLRDSVRLVRDEAARVLASVPSNLMPQQQRTVLDSAVSSYIDAQLTNADRPEAHINIGLVHFARERFDQAEQAFARAIRVDSSFVAAYVDLAELRRVQGRDTDGEVVLDRALALAPDNGTVHHALGLLYVRQRRMREALHALRRATELAPDDARFAYVYGVALHSESRVDEAVAVLEEASTRHPYDLDLLGTLVTINRDRGDFGSAIRHAERLASLVPGNRNFQNLLDQLRTQAGR